jgi:Dna[CI] antecedent DciA-like protein
MELGRIKPNLKGSVRVGSLVDKVLADMGLSKTLAGWKVVVFWPEIVGEHLARYSSAIRYEDGVLLVSVPDAARRQELSLQVDEMIMEKIHNTPGGKVVKRIRFIS